MSYLDLAKRWRHRIKNGQRMARTLLLAQERMKRAVAENNG